MMNNSVVNPSFNDGMLRLKSRYESVSLHACSIILFYFRFMICITIWVKLWDTISCLNQTQVQHSSKRSWTVQRNCCLNRKHLNISFQTSTNTDKKHYSRCVSNVQIAVSTYQIKRGWSDQSVELILLRYFALCRVKQWGQWLTKAWQLEKIRIISESLKKA